MQCATNCIYNVYLYVRGRSLSIFGRVHLVFQEKLLQTITSKAEQSDLLLKGEPVTDSSRLPIGARGSMRCALWEIGFAVVCHSC